MIEDWLLVTLHGYGESGEELRSKLSPGLPARAGTPHWCAPDGPLRRTLGGKGFGWFGLTGRLDLTRSRALECLPGVREQVRAAQRDLGVTRSATAAVGFSQGGVLAAALLAEGMCVSAAVLCAPVTLDVGSLVEGRPSACYVVGGQDRLVSRKQLFPNHPIFTAGTARWFELSTMGHEVRVDAATAAMEFVFSVIERDSKEG